jgi:hypothetical protein
MNEPNLTVMLPSDLTDKWGFGDGDMFDDVLADWLTRASWSGRQPDQDTYDHPYFSSRLLLIEYVTRHLLPVLPEDLRPLVHRVMTVHNPVRISPELSGDGLYEDDEQELDLIAARLERIDPVEVTNRDVDVVCNSLFPLRGPGWMALYESVYWPAVRNDFLPASDHQLDRWDIGYRLRAFVNALGDSYHDDEMLLAAEIVPNHPLDNVSSSVILAALDSARRVLR